MPLRNRVDPSGSIHADNSRGMFTGNRGVIHDPDTKTLKGRRWTTKSWIVCTCDFRGRRRDPMGRNGRNGGTGWTELFFLDEVTSLAAGHRPCFYCRRDDATAFQRAWSAACGGVKQSAPQIDQVLHVERRVSAVWTPQALSAIDLPGLPDGTIVEAKGHFFALKDRQALLWSFGGYSGPRDLGDLLRNPVSLVTPGSTMKALRHGFKPVWHDTAA